MKTLAILLSLHTVCYTKLNPEIILISINNWNLRKENLSKWKILERGLQIRIEVSTNTSTCTSYSWRTSVFKTTIVDRRLSTEVKIPEERLLIIVTHLAKLTTSYPFGKFNICSRKSKCFPSQKIPGFNIILVIRVHDGERNTADFLNCTWFIW